MTVYNIFKVVFSLRRFRQLGDRPLTATGDVKDDSCSLQLLICYRVPSSGCPTAYEHEL
jgi:hypothetical protein